MAQFKQINLNTHLIHCILCVLFCFAQSYLCAEAAVNPVQTTYAEGMFSSYCKTEVNTDSLTANKVIDDLIKQFQGDPERLFDWALKDCGQQSDSEKDAVILLLNSTTYNPETGISILNVDAVVPGFTSFRDINIESFVTDTLHANGEREIRVEIFYSGNLLKKSNGVFFVKMIENKKIQYSIQINVKFGWFFNLFITKRRYKTLTEFRVEKFMQNLKDEAERRIFFSAE